MGYEIVIIAVLIAVGGLLSMSEIAIVSVRRSRLEQLAQEGSRRAKIALELATTPQIFLSTVQCGMTLIGTFAGAFGGATLSKNLSYLFEDLPYVGQHSEAISFGVVVVSITYITIVVGELVPKTVALNHAEAIALIMAKPMRALLRATYPFVRILSGSTTGVLRLLRIQEASGQDVTQDEIQIMLEQGAESGTLDEAEQKMVEGIFRLGDRLISLLMTKRKDVVWIDIHDSVQTNLEKMTESHHSHFPVCDGTLDKVIGMVNVKDILVKVKNRQDLDLHEVLTAPLFVPDNLPALRVLNQFKVSGTHIALVLDEYGSFEGLVTLNDFMEAIIGEMSTGGGAMEAPQVVRREDGSWLVDGQLAVDELKELLGVQELYEESRGDYQTLAGMVLTILGRIPETGDTLTWESFKFEIVDMDENRIDKILISRLAPEEDAIPPDPSSTESQNQ
jgi:putative hemolysin